MVPYRWYNVDDPDGARLLAAAGAEASQAPVVITSDGQPLVQPSLVEVANAVGLSTTPQGEFYDVVIIGSGPAGLGAAVYAASEGLRTVVVERAAAGGQAGQSSRIENYLGFPDGVSGDQLTDRARRQALRFGAELLTARTVVGLRGQRPRAPRCCSTTDPRCCPCGRAGHRSQLSPARGGGRRRARRPRGLLRLVGDPGRVLPGDHVIIVGGANSAGQAAVFFSRHAARVTMAVRGDSLGEVHVVVLDRADRRGIQHRGPAEHLGAKLRGQRSSAVRDLCRS